MGASFHPEGQPCVYAHSLCCWLRNSSLRLGRLVSAALQELCLVVTAVCSLALPNFWVLTWCWVCFFIVVGCVGSCFGSVPLLSSDPWNMETYGIKNLGKTFTGQDRVMKNCNVTTLYQLSLKWFKAPSLLRSSQSTWTGHHNYMAVSSY